MNIFLFFAIRLSNGGNRAPPAGGTEDRDGFARAAATRRDDRNYGSRGRRWRRSRGDFSKTERVQDKWGGEGKRYISGVYFILYRMGLVSGDFSYKYENINDSSYANESRRSQQISKRIRETQSESL